METLIYAAGDENCRKTGGKLAQEVSLVSRGRVDTIDDRDHEKCLETWGRLRTVRRYRNDRTF